MHKAFDIMSGRRRGSTQIIGHTEFRGHELTVYDNRKIPGLKATIFPPEEVIRGPFGKHFSATLHIRGKGTKTVQMHKSARRVAGNRVVPVLEADI